MYNFSVSLYNAGMEDKTRHKGKNTFNTIYGIVKRIPRGYVASYGQIAMLAGNPKMSRIVGYAMRACGDESVPCRRVVHKDGSLSRAFGTFGAEEQRMLLESEGVTFLADGRVDMAKHSWRDITT